MSESKISAEVICLTPELAAGFLEKIPPAVEMLDGTYQQRPYRQNTVDAYARELISGRWRENSQTIAFSIEGWMIDGQHRCRAVVQTGIPMTVVMVKGITLSSIDTIDRGAKRTISDVFTMSGMNLKLARTASTASRLEYAFARTGNPFQYSTSTAPSAAELTDLLAKNPALVYSCERANDICGHGSLFQRSHIALLIFRSGLNDPNNICDSFYEGLVTGAGLTENDPRLWIRNKLMREGGSRSRLSPQFKVALIAKAWNRARDMKPISSEPNFFKLNWEMEFRQLRTPEELSEK